MMSGLHSDLVNFTDPTAPSRIQRRDFVRALTAAGTAALMTGAPRQPQEPIFDRLMSERALLAGSWMAILGFGTFAVALSAGMPIDNARNTLLLLMVLLQNVDALNARSESRSVLGLPLRNNPVLLVGIAVALAVHVVAMNLPVMQATLRLAAVPPLQWLVLPLLALS